MANDVFANSREISCKSADGKSICAFPDVCFTPPTTPATPPGVPIPYPNTGMASDTTSGSKTVKISGKEVMLKNKSYFKKSTGDEAGCAPKKGVLTSKNMGKVYFNSWSMDVKIEGENAVRHFDLTTHNHMSFPGNTPTWPYCDTLATGQPGKGCKKERDKVKKHCAGKSEDEQCKSKKCKAARKCMLVPFDAPKDTLGNAAKCCPGETGHHVIPVQEFSEPGKPRGRPLPGCEGYKENLAPCVCAEGEVHNEWEGKPPYQLKEHGRLGNAYISERQKATPTLNVGDPMSYSDVNDAGAASVNKVFPQCSKGCIKAQLDNYHNKAAKIPKKKVLRKSKQDTQQEYKPSPGKTRKH